LALGLDDQNRPSTESTVPQPQSRVHERIGPYRILELLGEGGMGSVYLVAQEAPIRRRVALKLIKLGMDSAQVLARFESERQALALMSHTGVAKVFDAGLTPNGRPYFVMEYVAGLPITDYCDKRRLNLRERLGLFVQTCEAIHHAHQKGIIHRDVKPSNILVAEQDGRPLAKVIDFGVAKAISQRLTARTLFTQQGVMVGTPEYMSPEQAGVTALDVDERADVYSLGVVLYELLVGARPFDLREMGEAGALEMLLHVIREADPPTPEKRLSALDAKAEEIAWRRQTDVRSLSRALRGELAWITMRTLEKQPARRYASVSELAADVGRYLAGEPVTARPPTARYRMAKWIRRRRAFVASAAAIALLLVAGAVATGILQWRAQRARENVLRVVLEDVVATRNYSGLAGLSESDLGRLHRKIEADPRGEIARLAYRAAAHVGVDVPAFGLISEPPQVYLLFGGVPAMLVVPDSSKVLWQAEIEASWDGEPAPPLLKKSWDSRSLEINSAGTDLRELLGSVSLAAGPHRLSLRATITSYLGSAASERDDLTANAPLDRETRELGVFPVSLFSSFPPDFPHAVTLDEPAESLFRVDAVRLVTVSLPPRAGKCILFPWPGAEPAQVETVCLPPADLPPRGLIVGFEFKGTTRVEGSVPIAMTASVDAPGLEKPVLVFDITSTNYNSLRFGRAWNVRRESMWTFMTVPGGDYKLDGIGAILKGLAAERLFHVTDLPRDEPVRDEPVRGELRLTPSRSVALATRRFDRYLGNAMSLPIELIVSEVSGAWTDEIPRDASRWPENEASVGRR
jgi:serine/threonine protein kinase